MVPGLVIWDSKSLRRFLSLSLNTKQASVCWVCHKTDKGRTAWDKHQDLAACFIWKQVALGFSSLTLRLAEARRRVLHMALSRRLRQNQVEDGWVDVMSCVRPYYSYFAVFYVLDTMRILVFYLGL
jgi:hypothetical protein